MFGSVFVGFYTMISGRKSFETILYSAEKFHSIRLIAKVIWTRWSLVCFALQFIKMEFGLKVAPEVYNFLFEIVIWRGCQLKNPIQRIPLSNPNWSKTIKIHKQAAKPQLNVHNQNSPIKLFGKSRFDSLSGALNSVKPQTLPKNNGEHFS